MQKAANFLNSIKKEDKIFIYVHDDTDGLTSLALLSVFLQNRMIEYRFKISEKNDRENFLDVFKTIKKEYDFDVLILADIDLGKETYDEIKGKILCLDHHKLEQYGDLITYYNPRSETTKPPSASAVVYKVCELAGFNDEDYEKDYAWVALLGSYADKMFNASIDFMKLSSNIEESYATQRQLDQYFIPAIEVLSLSYTKPSFALPLFEMLMKAIELKNPCYFWEIKDDSMYFDELRKIDSETKEILSNNEPEIKNDVLFFSIPKSRYDLKRMVADYFSIVYPDKTIIVYRHTDYLDISLRSHLVDLTKLLVDISKEMSLISFGGHPVASGAKSEIKDEKLFKYLISKHHR